MHGQNHIKFSLGYENEMKATKWIHGFYLA